MWAIRRLRVPRATPAKADADHDPSRLARPGRTPQERPSSKARYCACRGTTADRAGRCAAADEFRRRTHPTVTRKHGRMNTRSRVGPCAKRSIGPSSRRTWRARFRSPRSFRPSPHRSAAPFVVRSCTRLSTDPSDTPLSLSGQPAAVPAGPRNVAGLRRPTFAGFGSGRSCAARHGAAGRKRRGSAGSVGQGVETPCYAEATCSTRRTSVARQKRARRHRVRTHERGDA